MFFCREVQDTNKVTIIAEIGECFNGDFQIANKLIWKAKEAGCDIVKFQTLDKEEIAETDPEREWFEKIALDPEKINLLIQMAEEAQIHILFTPENPETASWLVDAGRKDIKIGSSSLTNEPLLQYVNKYFSTVYLSTGMASLDEIQHAIALLSGVSDLTIMHCISEYPTGPLLETRGLKALSEEDVHLRMILILMLLFPQHTIGYSDHTAGILAPVAAVAMGARVIEKHITLDRKTPIQNFLKGKEYLGTDHILSLEPDELKQMVKNIRSVEKMLGEWKWERTAGENILKEFLRQRFPKS